MITYTNKTKDGVPRWEDFKAVRFVSCPSTCHFISVNQGTIQCMWLWCVFCFVFSGQGFNQGFKPKAEALLGGDITQPLLCQCWLTQEYTHPKLPVSTLPSPAWQAVNEWEVSRHHLTLTPMLDPLHWGLLRHTVRGRDKRARQGVWNHDVVLVPDAHCAAPSDRRGFRTWGEFPFVQMVGCWPGCWDGSWFAALW